MIYSIIGNNDGPLLLYRSLKANTMPVPVLVGLQKKPNATLYEQYQAEIPASSLFVEFDETKVLERLEETESRVLINCFCNFKFVALLKKYYCINIHPSYLPAYRGRHPMHWALIRGESYHGITIHVMNERFDDGAILWQEKVELQPDYSVQELRKLLMKMLTSGFPDFIKKLSKDKLERKENLPVQGSYVRARKPEDSKLTEWSDPDLLYRKIKALRSEPYPAYLETEKEEKIPVINVTWETSQMEENNTGVVKFPFIQDQQNGILKIRINKKELFILKIPKIGQTNTNLKLTTT